MQEMNFDDKTLTIYKPLMAQSAGDAEYTDCISAEG